VGVEQGEWRARRGTAALVRASVLIAPFALSVATGLVLGRALPGKGQVPWWLAVLAASTIALVAADRLARRLLPLAVLLDLSLLFPDQAPSRFKVALTSGSVKHVHDSLADQPDTAEEIVALVAALGAHHRPSRKHSERVRAYTELVADELRLPETDRHRLRWAALLHDIGKVDVPIEVLNGTGPLSDEGWRVIHRHPIDGAKLIEPLRPWLGPWAATVEQHHERFDGGGYPHALSGDAICMGARIVAVADSFEAMTARRSYQEPMPLDRARARLAELAGTQFDPVVVRAFLNVSLSRLRWAYGPLAWVAEAPLLAGLAQLAPAAGAGVRAGTAALGVAVAATAVGTAAAAPRPATVAGVTFARAALAAPRSASGPAPTTSRATVPAPSPTPTPAVGVTGAAPVNTTTTTTTIPVTIPVTVPTTLPPVTVTLPTLPPLTLPIP
jgi:putative nucleotidyltransferase with HDIG domain